ncbi:MAG: argininosuccinate lyase [Nitrospirae bacterium]|nr:argininosuccinate lyase [Nitrospirota bacterium]MBI3594851.1 argininosuccinate lyase [Nitrospirota bacterium]
MAVKKESHNKKLWGGRFSETTRLNVEKFTSSIHFDKRLARFDIEGSIAHCKTLHRAGILSRSESAKMIQGLETIQIDIEKGKFKFLESAEDIHMNIELRLIEKIGPVGGKLHTGRSRNDQVVLDLRLYLRSEAEEILGLLNHLQKVMILLAQKHLEAVMPGYTHLQKAQPVLFSHHILAYYEMFERDKERMGDLLRRVNVMPLGSGALAGSGFPLDREYTARLLSFPSVSQNSLDAVSDRDFVIEFHSFASICMMHLSRLSEELVLWSSSEFGFVELPDGFCTGSSMMPQKKNPDVPELIRGKTGHVYGNLVSALTLMKGLPLSYNRDLQEDKVPLFQTLDLIKPVLALTAELLSGLKVNRLALLEGTKSGFLLATDIADYLVGQGVPFRIAHEITGKIVRYCMECGKSLEELTIQEYWKFSRRFNNDIIDLTLNSSLAKRDVIGGTAKSRVVQRLNQLKKRHRIAD